LNYYKQIITIPHSVFGTYQQLTIIVGFATINTINKLTEIKKLKNCLKT